MTPENKECWCATLPPEIGCCDVCKAQRQADWEAEMQRDQEKRTTLERAKEAVCRWKGEDWS